ncbi:MAG: hypothetical protein WA843_03070 [Candidatus Saccharimonadales bacterium]
MNQELPSNFSTPTFSEQIKTLLPDRFSKVKYYGVVACATIRSIPRDAAHNLCAAFSNQLPTRNFQKEYLHRADAHLFDMLVKNGTLQLQPESLLDKDWRSEIDT